jgi:hypothetical protein
MYGFKAKIAWLLVAAPTAALPSPALSEDFCKILAEQEEQCAHFGPCMSRADAERFYFACMIQRAPEPPAVCRLRNEEVHKCALAGTCYNDTAVRAHIEQLDEECRQATR